MKNSELRDKVEEITEYISDAEEDYDWEGVRDEIDDLLGEIGDDEKNDVYGIKDTLNDLSRAAVYRIDLISDIEHNGYEVDELVGQLEDKVFHSEDTKEETKTEEDSSETE